MDPSDGRRSKIDAQRALALKMTRSWDEVGRVLAEEEGRKTAYTANSMSRAAARWKAGKR